MEGPDQIPAQNVVSENWILKWIGVPVLRLYTMTREYDREKALRKNFLERIPRLYEEIAERQKRKEEIERQLMNKS